MKAKQQFSQAQIPLFVFDLISNLPLLLCGI
jgi:hypothetical protein